MKYSTHGHKDRNRHNHRFFFFFLKREMWTSSVDLCQRHKPSEQHPHHVKVSPRGQIRRISQLVRQLVSWRFEPSQPQRITSGLYTNFAQSPSYSFHESFHHKSCFCFVLFVFQPIYIPRALNTGTCIQQGDISGVSHIQHRKKNWERFWKICR